MSSRERLEEALEGGAPDRMPFSPFLAYVWESLPQAVQDAGQLAFHHRIDADPLWRGAPCPVKASVPTSVQTRTWHEGARRVIQTVTPVGSLRRAYLKTAAAGDQTEFLVEHPLKTEDDYKIQLWLEEHTTYILDMAPVEEHLAGEGREGLSIGMLLPRAKSAFQDMVEHLAGTEELAYALADFTATVEALWEAMVTNDLRAAEMAIEAPYRYYLTWEDSGTQNYSPRAYRRYIASEIAHWAALLEGAGKRYIQHACGHLEAILEPMKASGAFGVESLSPPPTGNITLAASRALVGDDWPIIGGIEPTQFLNLSLDELIPYVEQVLADGTGPSGHARYVLANSDSCPPGVTLAKFAAVAELARGWRP
jgi:hypothetical protein